MNIRRLTDTGEWSTRRYLSLLGNILIWVIVAIDAFYLWPTQLHGSTSMVIVSGHSMEATYFTGDLVIARKMTPSVGDVIVYAPDGFGGSQIVHRIVGGNAVDGWVMKGDNNPNVDPFTPKGDEIRGVVLVHYANFGRVTVLLLNPIVWALVLLAAVVLLVWWSGDTCEDDPEDRDKDTTDTGGEPEPDVEEELDVIDRMVEGTEAALARMVSSTAGAGTAALAVLTRTSPAPRHAVRMPRHTAFSPRRAAPVYLRVSAIIAMLGFVAVFGSSAAWASSLGINTGGNIFTKTYAPCTTATLGVTYTGTANPAGSTMYPSIAITGLTGCANLKLSYTAYGSTGQLFSGSNITVVAGTTIVSPGATYDATLVQRVAVTVNGWPLTNVWTGPPPPAPPTAGNCDGLLSNGQNPSNTTCALSWTPTYGTPYEDHRSWFIWWYGYYVSDVNVSFTTTFTATSPNTNTDAQTQANTSWRATFDLTTFTVAGANWPGPPTYSVGDLSTHFYVYKASPGNNTTLAPGTTCSDATKVTFQELSPTSNGTGGFIVSARQIPGKTAADLICSK